MLSRATAFIVCIFLFASGAVSQCTTPLSNFFVPGYDGFIESAEPSVTGDTVYLGGSFNSLSKYSGNLCRVGSQSSSAAVSMPVVDGEVFDIISDGDGGWYIGGSFKHVGGLERSNLARIARNGQVHAFTMNTNGTVYSLHLLGSRLFFGGQFTMANQQTRNYLAGADTSGALLPWDPSLNSFVYKVGSKNGQLLAGGAFSSINGFGRSYLAIIDTATALPAAWSASVNGAVLGFHIDDSLVYINGTFSTAGAVSRNRIAAVRWVNGSVYTPLNITQNGNIRSLFVSGNELYLTGDFTQVNAATRNRFASVNKLTGTNNSLAFNFDADVRTVKVMGDDIFIGGDFTQVNGDKSKKYLIRASLANGLIKNWDPLLNNAVNSVFSSDSTILLGGAFQGYYRTQRSNLAAVKLSSMELLPWAPVVPQGNAVRKLHFIDQKIIIGGAFDSVNSTYRKNLAMVDLNGQLTPWDPSPNQEVSEINSAKGVVYLAGNFTIIGGLNRRYLAAVNADLGNVTTFNPNPNAVVTFIKPYGDKLYFAGRFTSISSNSRYLFAVYDISASAQNPSIITGPSLSISSTNLATFLEAGYGRVFVGYKDYASSFTYPPKVFSFDTVTFNDVVKMVDYANGDMGQMVLSDSAAIISISNGGNTRIAKMSFDGLMSVDLASTNEVTYLKKAGDKLIVHGYFANLGGSEVNRLGLMSLSHKVDITASMPLNKLCAGDSLTFTSSALSSTLWNDFSSNQTRTFNPLSALNYTVFAKGQVPGCALAVSDFIRFKVNDKPSISISSNSNPFICKGEMAVFSVNTSQLNSFVWSTGGSDAQKTITAAGTYSATATNMYGCSSTASLTQNYYPVPAKPTVTPSGNIRMCSDSLLLLRANVPANITFLQWLHGPYDIVTGTMVSGSFRVYYRDSVNCMSDTSDAVNVIADTFPHKPLITSSKAAFCGNADSITLSVEDMVTDSLKWSTGLTAASLVIYDTLNYYVTSYNGACSAVSDPVSFADIKPAKPLVSSSKNPAVICAGELVTLSSAYNGTNIWSDGRTGKSITAGKEGAYRAVAVVSGCASDSSDSVWVKVNPVPDAALLTLRADTILSSADSNNTWYLNNQLRNELKGNFILPQINGDYSVIVVNSFGCKSAKSNVIKYISTGVDEIAEALFAIYPNPAYREIYVLPAPAMQGAEITITLTDVLGRQWYSERHIAGSQSIPLQVQELPAGHYIVTLSAQGRSYHSKVLIAK